MHSSWILFTGLALLGCSKTRPNATTADSTPPAALSSDERAKDHGSRKLMGLDVPVLVDRVQRGALRYGDLPKLPDARAWNGATGFRLYDYVASLGVAPGSVRAIHLHTNGHRVSTIEGSELVARKNDLVFGFSSGDTGSPIARWSSSKLKDTFNVHEIRRVSVFVRTEAPAVDRTRQCSLSTTGECSEAAYDPESGPAKGTRIYVDGKMIAHVKRRTLGDSLVVGQGEDGLRKFSLTAYLAQVGVDLSQIGALEAVAGDDVVARAEGSLSSLAATLSFTTPEHGHGKVRLLIPASMQAENLEARDRSALVTSIMLFRDTKSAARPLAEISEETDKSVMLAARTADSE